jgi:hypothetical protein
MMNITRTGKKKLKMSCGRSIPKHSCTTKAAAGISAQATTSAKTFAINVERDPIRLMIASSEVLWGLECEPNQTPFDRVLTIAEKLMRRRFEPKAAHRQSVAS